MKSKKGFTLIELLVTIIIIAILASSAVIATVFVFNKKKVKSINEILKTNCLNIEKTFQDSSQQITPKFLRNNKNKLAEIFNLQAIEYIKEILITPTIEKEKDPLGRERNSYYLNIKIIGQKNLKTEKKIKVYNNNLNKKVKITINKEKKFNMVIKK